MLNRASPLFREPRYLLAAETELQDMGLYHSVLAAIAGGNATSGGIAGYIGRKSGDLAHPLNVLGPHFEQLCRHWVRYFAPEEITGGFPSRVEPGTVNDPASKTTRQIDVAAFAVGDNGQEAMLAIGEAKWHETMGLAHLERLRRIRGLLTAQGRPGAATARLLCFSGAGFTAELRDEAAQSGEVRLLAPADLYAGILLQSLGDLAVPSEVSFPHGSGRCLEAG